jgi:hypothetical protein
MIVTSFRQQEVDRCRNADNPIVLQRARVLYWDERGFPDFRQTMGD